MGVIPAAAPSSSKALAHHTSREIPALFQPAALLATAKAVIETMLQQLGEPARSSTSAGCLVTGLSKGGRGAY